MNIRLFSNMFYFDNILDNNHQIRFFVIYEINDIQHVLDVHDNRKWKIDYRDYEEYFQQQDEEYFHVYLQNLTILVLFDRV